MDPDQTAPFNVCLYAKCNFEKFARRCSRRHKQTTFSDANFLGALRVNLMFIVMHIKLMKFASENE